MMHTSFSSGETDSSTAGPASRSITDRIAATASAGVIVFSSFRQFGRGLLTACAAATLAIAHACKRFLN